MRAAPDAAAMPRRLLIVGPQGSGKGTQGSRIASWFGIPAVSTGDVFRGHVVSRTALGIEIESVIASGHLVSDDLTERLVRDRLDQPDADGGFLLDGYPRNRAQLKDLDEYLAVRGQALDAVIELRVSQEESIRRLERRALLQGRDDDVDEVIAHRLTVYRQETAPLLDDYASRRVLITVDGTGLEDEVTSAIRQALLERKYLS